MVDGQFEIETIKTRTGGVKARVVLEDDAGNRTWVYVCVPELAAIAQELTVTLKAIEDLRRMDENNVKAE